MKKLLIIVHSLHGGGAERVIVNICQKLDQSKYNITLALFKKSGVYFDLLPAYIKLIDLNISRSRYSLIKVYRLIKNEKPDIVFSTSTDINIILCFLKKIIGYKLVIRIINIISFYKNRTVNFIFRLLINSADAVIAQSNDMKSDLINNFKCNISIIYKINNPINFEYINKQNKEDLDINFPPNKIMLLAVGRLEYQKGLDLLLQTFSELPDKDKYHLIILGSGSLKSELDNYAKSQKIEHLTSFIDFDINPYKYMARANFLISSSRYEGFPNTVIEALACGTPVIANDYPGGINEIITDDVGAIIDIKNVSLFSEKLNKIYNSDIIKNYCKDKFSIENIIKEYENIFDNI